MKPRRLKQKEKLSTSEKISLAIAIVELIKLIKELFK